MVSMEELTGLVVRFLRAADRLLPEPLVDLEFNPVVLTARGAVALDAAGSLAAHPVREADAPGEVGRQAARRKDKIARLLAPESVAILGVSERGVNPGRIILRNMLRRGFPAERLFVVKEGDGPIDGCPRVPDLDALADRAGPAGRVDLLVLAVAGGQVPEIVDEVVAGRRAESLVVIPGGLGETAGSADRAAAVRATLEAARRTDWGGPVVNGGNCLGVRSVPGRVDTLFIPRHKLRFPERMGSGSDPAPDPLALVSQSGAFAIARASKLRTLDPRHLITVGNQLDLTVGDYVEHLVDDPASRVVACYVEGFRPGDGARFLRAAAEIVRQGRSVLLYRAGRTAAGARASASHTASIAGDFAVSRELARAAGVVVADTLEDFEDLVGLFTRLDGRVGSTRRPIQSLGALTNAGFEAVAIADRLGSLRLAEYAPETRRRVEEILRARRLEEIVTVGNPLDLTPMLDDEGFAEAARAVLEDPGVDLGVISCVPLTGALETVARFDPGGPDPGADPGADPGIDPDTGHDEDGTRPTGVAARLAALTGEISTPWVAVVDSGPLYDPMVRLLEDAGVPTFRATDRAVRLLAAWAEHRGGPGARRPGP
jgi:acyl-CoA synthetase (NDP forming)